MWTAAWTDRQEKGGQCRISEQGILGKRSRSTMPTSLDACPLFIRLFGPLEVHLRGQRLRPLRTRKGEWLLALLALRRDQPVERAWLAGTLWPESDHRQGADSLRRTLTDLRQALGEEARRILSPTTHTLSLQLAEA